MKKSILIGVLAALMLFAFTACENNSSAIGLVDRITAVQNATYVTGEKADAADFTFTGYTTYGDEVALDSADVTLADTELTAENNKVAVYYQGEEINTINVEAEEATELRIEGTATAKFYGTLTSSWKDPEGKTVPTATERNKAFDATGLTVYAVYDGGEKQLSLDEVKFAIADWTVSGNEAEEKEVTVTLGTTKTVTGKVKVDVLPNLVTGVQLVATKDYVVYSDVANLDEVAYCADPSADKAAGIYMVATYEGGENVVVATGSVNYVVGTVDGKDEIGDLAKFNTDVLGKIITEGTENSVSITAVYAGTDGVVGLNKKAAAVSVGIEKDSVKELSVVITAGTFKAGTNYEAEGASIASGVTVKTVMKSGDAENVTTVSEYVSTADIADTKEKTYYTISGADFTDSNAGDRVSMTVTAYIDNNGKTESYSKTVQTVLADAE